MRWLSACALFFAVFRSGAQDTFRAYFEPGPYPVAYADTVIYNSANTYNEFGYSGPEPIFVQIWFPAKHNNGNDSMQMGDFWKRTVPDPLQGVISALSREVDSSRVKYNIREDFVTWSPIDYGELSCNDVLARIKTYPLNYGREPLEFSSNKPVIVYHHGSQGMSDENFAMAEYFASRGYAFVSANYHLPYAGQIYGLNECTSGNTSTGERVMQFARSLTNNPSLFYIGHSWGAQRGWLMLHKKGLADAFVSLETTIEAKIDPAEIQDKWAFVYDVIVNQNKRYPLPILMFANTQENKPFSFFENKGESTQIYVSAKEEFGHESYTSAYLLRYLYRETIPQPDTVPMRKQLQLYAKTLKLIEAFFNSVETQKPFDDREFLDDFYINARQ